LVAPTRIELVTSGL